MPCRPDTPCAICGTLLWSGTGSRPGGLRICRPCRKTNTTPHRRKAAPPTLKLRTCEQCGNQYSSTDKRQRTCSRACGYLLVHGPGAGSSRERSCTVCSAKFFVRLSGRQSAQSTCSRACAVEWRRRNCEPTYPASRVYLIDCVICGKPVTARNRRQKACSAAECKRAHHAQYMAQYMNSHYGQLRSAVLARTHIHRARLYNVPTERIDIRYLCERDKWRCGICHKPVKRKSKHKRDPLGPSIDHIIPLTKGGSHTTANTQLAHLRCNLSKGNRGGHEQLMLFG